MKPELIISSTLFAWHADESKFTSEASILEHELKQQGRSRLEYRDGKWGFWMQSERTGNLAWFEITQENKVGNELQSLDFVSWPAPGRPLLNCVVFND